MNMGQAEEEVEEEKKGEKVKGTAEKEEEGVKENIEKSWRTQMERRMDLFAVPCDQCDIYFKISRISMQINKALVTIQVFVCIW